MNVGDTFPIMVQTEDGQWVEYPAADKLAELLRMLGWPGNSWLIAEPVDPPTDEDYLQVLRESESCYRVEIRVTSTEEHVATLAGSAATVLDVVEAWSARDGSWRSAAAWAPFPEFQSEVPPAPGIAADAESEARTILAGGFLSRFEIARALVLTYSESDHSMPLTQAQAERIVDRAWQERLAEQETWPARTDPDAVAEAFAALEKQGIRTRENFSCCTRCGHDEIRAEFTADTVGYVFYHWQSLEAAVAHGGLMLHYGGIDRNPESGAGAAVARRLVDALTAAGLPAEWDGNPLRAVKVSPIVWRRRLPA